jgi:hypothetical protein
VDAAALISRLANERWRALLLPLLDPDQTVRNAALKDLEDALRKPQHGGADLRLVADDVPRLVEIGMTVTFPPTWRTWSSPAHDVLFWFVTIKHAWLAQTIAAHYAAADDGARLDAITILAAQRNEEALRTLGTLIERYGMPGRMYSRFFWELNDSFEYADCLMPQLILQAGRYIPHVMDFVNIAHERGKLSPEKLVPALDLVEQKAAELLAAVRRRQRRDGGTRWRFEEKYIPLSHSLGAFLDLLSLIPGASVATLQKAAALADPRLLSIVAIGLLRRGVEPAREIVRIAAASHVVRADLYRALNGLGRLDIFPAENASFEAFAASHMARWLAYPSELGYEPEVLQLAAILRGTTGEGERRWCLWKFEDADGAAFAAVSGPYALEPLVGPLEGGDVFSNFAEWDSASPEQHLQAVLATLRDWRLDSAAR